MLTTFTEWQNYISKLRHTECYKPLCPYCGVKIMVSQDEMKITPFEPTEKEFEKIVIDYDETNKRVISECKEIVKHQISSDINKDIYEFECPECGKLCKFVYEDLCEYFCSFFGDNNKRFTLDAVETQNVKDFMKEHKHVDEFRNKGKFGFSTLGQQFTYTITPSGLGNSVTIKCNRCGESKDITNIDNL